LCGHINEITNRNAGFLKNLLSKTEPLTVPPFLDLCNRVDSSSGYTKYSPWPVFCESNSRHNEPVGKVLLMSKNDVFRGLLTLPKHKIVDCGAFQEVTFFCILPKDLFGDFFYSLND
jgi:hypothetical protein